MSAASLTIGDIVWIDIPSKGPHPAVVVLDLGDGGYIVTTYSEFDPVRISEALVRVLRYFDGRPTEEALEAIRLEQRIRVDLSLVRRLVDFGILKASELEQGAFPLTFSR